MRSRTPRLLISWVIGAHGEDRVRVRKGSERLAEMADAWGVPLTWALDARGARSLADFLSERREQRRLSDAGDETVLLWLDTASWREDSPFLSDSRLVAERLVRERERFRERLLLERTRLGEVLPWARPKIAGAHFKNSALVTALEAEGFEALWGYSTVSERGSPFGYFMVGRERHLSAGVPSSVLVGIPREFSLVPSLAEALKAIRENAEYNLFFGLTLSTDAEEVASWSSGEADVLRNFWARARELDFRAVSLGEAVAFYRERFGETEPTTFLWKTPDRRMLFYYDARAQFVFEEGSVTPSTFFNYRTPSYRSVDLSEDEPPRFVSFVPTRERERLRLDFSLDAPKPMPYALCLWGDHRHLRLLDSNVLEVRPLGSDALLVLFDLFTGVNDFFLVLTI